MLNFDEIMEQVEAGMEPEAIGKNILDSIDKSQDHSRAAYNSAGRGELQGRNSAVVADDFELMPNVPIWDEQHSQRMLTDITGQIRALKFREKKGEALEIQAKGDKRFASAAFTQAEVSVIEAKTANQGLMLNQVYEQGKLIESGTNLIIAERGVIDGRAHIKIKQAEAEALKGQEFLRSIHVEAQRIAAETDQKLAVAQEQFDALKGAGPFGSYDT